MDGKGITADDFLNAFDSMPNYAPPPPMPVSQRLYDLLEEQGEPMDRYFVPGELPKSNKARSLRPNLIVIDDPAHD